MANKVSNDLQPWHRLEGKVAMVTGASSGLGSDFSLDLAKAGSNIIAAARQTHRLNSLCHEINHFTCPNSPPSPNTTVRAVAVALDLTAYGPAINASVQKAWEAFGRIERMRDGGVEGSIININRGEFLGSVAYASSKAGLITMTFKAVMAIELGMHNIRVNGIMLMKKHWIKSVALRILPLKALGSSDPALTSLVRYSVHDTSKYVSSNIFIIDSGATLPGIPIFSSL
ncbi:hypothetical protein PVL29_010044 [Vitis rotundifolia]|uniref:Uncharacterized protein n=1 Tax=Vitis rotundifolia TaxID=103349 RepID=A0AA38ZSE3_VITRO|nr:hypothetical protein PVL29_010044 [Vitis rotundifolia]